MLLVTYINYKKVLTHNSHYCFVFFYNINFNNYDISWFLCRRGHFYNPTPVLLLLRVILGWVELFYERPRQTASYVVDRKVVTFLYQWLWPDMMPSTLSDSLFFPGGHIREIDNLSSFEFRDYGINHVIKFKLFCHKLVIIFICDISLKKVYIF